MTGRPNNRPTQAVPPALPRQNEYFVPRDGICREVITADICRFLGNDALVRPGTYETDDGVIQGYYVTAYRNLTSPMIQDLKAESLRWEQEIRAASRFSGSDAAGSREQRGESDYRAWRDRNYSSSAMDIDYPSAPAPARAVYSGQPYTAAPPANYPPTYAQPVHAAPPQFAAQPPYGSAPNPAPTQYSPQPLTSADRYFAIPPAIPAPYPQDNAAFVHGSNYQTAPGYATAGPTKGPTTMPHASGAPSRTYTGPAAGTPVYNPETDPYSYPAPAGNAAAQPYPADPHFGRGSPAGPTGRPGYGPPPEQQYDDGQNPALQSATTPAGAAPAQVTSTGAPAPRRDRDRDAEARERERERDHRLRRPEQERDERHADRPRHRHR